MCCVQLDLLMIALNPIAAASAASKPVQYMCKSRMKNEGRKHAKKHLMQLMFNCTYHTYRDSLGDNCPNT